MLNGPCRLVIGSALVALAPGLFLVLSSLVSAALGCPVDESDARSCMALGVDLGPLLYAGLVSGWLMLVTVPAGLCELLVAVSRQRLQLMAYSLASR